MSVEAFAYPRTIDEAVALLGDPSRRAIPVAGGTALALGGRRGAALLVDITRAGMDQIELGEDFIRVGACVRMADLDRARLPGAGGELLSEAARSIATETVRSAVTMGGNLVYQPSWAAMPVALLAVRGTVQAAHKELGRFDVPIDELAEQHPLQRLPKGSLVTGVTVPALREGGNGSAYLTFQITRADYPVLAAAASIRVEKATIAAASIAIGGAGPRPARAKAAESVLVGRPATVDSFAQAGRMAKEEAAFVSDKRMEDGAKKRVLGVLVRRALEQALERANGRAR